MEGATVLIEKIGILFDEAIQKADKAERKQTKDGQPTPLQKHS